MTVFLYLSYRLVFRGPKQQKKSFLKEALLHIVSICKRSFEHSNALYTFEFFFNVHAI